MKRTAFHVLFGGMKLWKTLSTKWDLHHDHKCTCLIRNFCTSSFDAIDIDPRMCKIQSISRYTGIDFLFNLFSSNGLCCNKEINWLPHSRLAKIVMIGFIWSVNETTFISNIFHSWRLPLNNDWFCAVKLLLNGFVDLFEYS